MRGQRAWCIHFLNLSTSEPGRKWPRHAILVPTTRSLRYGTAIQSRPRAPVAVSMRRPPQVFQVESGDRDRHAIRHVRGVAVARNR